MAESVYRVTEVIGTSSESWEDATRHAVETAALHGGHGMGDETFRGRVHAGDPAHRRARCA